MAFEGYNSGMKHLKCPSSLKPAQMVTLFPVLRSRVATAKATHTKKPLRTSKTPFGCTSKIGMHDANGASGLDLCLRKALARLKGGRYNPGKANPDAVERLS